MTSSQDFETYSPGNGYAPVTPPPSGYHPPLPATYGNGSSGQNSADPSTTDVAKDQAANLAGGASDAAQHVAGVAKDQVGQVTAEAGRQVKQLVGQAQSELTEQAQAQQEKLAGGLHAVADQLKSMANNSDQPGVATDLAHQPADKAHQFAGWLDDRDPGSVLNEVRSYARQRPGTFLALALGAGLIAGRLARGLAADPDDMAGGPTTTLPAAPYGTATGGAHALQDDPYGTGAVPDWTGKATSDTLGEAR